MLSIGIYCVAIFSSAFLIFLVQPMVGKRIVPWFGGVPAVWSVCLAFYQGALFIGYVYAHGMIRWIPVRLQFWIHAAFLGATVFSASVLPPAPPSSQQLENPAEAVLGLLISNVALPFVALASTGPLVQSWFARTHPTRSPYPLYAVSNLGSLVALIGYPFLIEPKLSLTELERVWSRGLLGASIAILACASPLIFAARGNRESAIDAEGVNSKPVTRRPYASWLLLSACAVTLLMSVTNQLCLDVASFPFLWIVPLALYLITFIIAFSSERAYHRPTMLAAALVCLFAAGVVNYETWIVYVVLAYGSFLFFACMVLHGELYRLRPEPNALTAFYLFVSAGGALGGLFVGLVAPRIFDDYYELGVGIAGAIALILAISLRDPTSFVGTGAPRWRRATAFVFALVLATVAALHQTTPTKQQIVHRERSFFGVLIVARPPIAKFPRLTLTNGTTSHGSQLTGPDVAWIPTTYYGRATGLGLALTSRPVDGESRIGVIGLGVGTLAAYGRQGDTIRFYEIDPAVVKISSRNGYFTFVENSKANVEIVVGDARRSLEDEQASNGSQEFDFLVIDAFSSDSIPVHLLTKEAFEVYFRALATDGLMAVHVSNRHFDLNGLVSTIAEDLGAHTLQIATDENDEMQSMLSQWVIVGRDSDQLTRLRIRLEKRHRLLRLHPNTIIVQRGLDTQRDWPALWTDDYSDLVSVMKWR